MIPVIREIDTDFLGLFQIPDITLTCRMELNAWRLIYSALTWTRKFSCKITGKNWKNKIGKTLGKPWENIERLLAIQLENQYWKKRYTYQRWKVIS